MANSDRSYWGVLPGEIVHDRALTIAAKYLYVILSSMAKRNGFCWPDNEDLAEEIQLSKRRVVELLGMLRDRGYIKIVFEQRGKKEQRYIYCGMFPDRVEEAPEGCEISQEGDAENSIPPCENSHTPMREIRFPNKDEPIKEPVKEPSPLTPQGDKPAKLKKTRAVKSEAEYRPEWFERFWKLYPRRTNRVAAVRAWDKLRPSLELCKVMTVAIKAQMKTAQWREGPDHIPHPSTWLNNARWTDEVSVPSSGGSPPEPEVRNGWR